MCSVVGTVVLSFGRSPGGYGWDIVEDVPCKLQHFWALLCAAVVQKLNALRAEGDFRRINMNPTVRCRVLPSLSVEPCQLSVCDMYCLYCL